jgi:hypothetical protein
MLAPTLSDLQWGEDCRWPGQLRWGIGSCLFLPWWETPDDGCGSLRTRRHRHQGSVQARYALCPRSPDCLAFPVRAGNPSYLNCQRLPEISGVVAVPPACVHDRTDTSDSAGVAVRLGRTGRPHLHCHQYNTGKAGDSEASNSPEQVACAEEAANCAARMPVSRLWESGSEEGKSDAGTG